MHSIAKSTSLVNTIKEKMYVEYKDTRTRVLAKDF